VAVQTVDCPIAYAGDQQEALFSAENAIFIGAMVAMNLRYPLQSTNWLALKLAINEINVAGGVPDPNGGPARPLVLSVCQSDTTADPEIAERGIEHLAAELEVPGVVTELLPDDLYDVFNLQKGRGLFYMNAIATSSALALRSNNQGLIWTLLGQPGDYAGAYALLLEDLEKYVRTARKLTPVDAIKVATVYTTDAFNADLFGTTDPKLSFNGVPADSQIYDADANPAGKYLRVRLDIARTDAAAVVQSKIQAAADEIVAFTPDIVISAAGSPMTTSDGQHFDGVLDRVEKAMPEPLPYYILSPYNAATSGLASVESEFGDAVAAGRFLGISAAAAPLDQRDVLNGFATRFNSVNGLDASIPGQVDNYYDAVYYLAYAMYAASLSGGMTGLDISNGMKRLTASDGTPLADGPHDIPNVFSALKNGDDIALNSTLGPPDFNPDTGVRPAIPSVYCFKWDAESLMPEHALDELRYDAGSDSFTGTYDCLDDFVP
jgi:hypothetical protein